MAIPSRASSQTRLIGDRVQASTPTWLVPFTFPHTVTKFNAWAVILPKKLIDSHETTDVSTAGRQYPLKWNFERTRSITLQLTNSVFVRQEQVRRKDRDQPNGYKMATIERWDFAVSSIY